jgi:inosine-uridine nucleoside N-ribohydrolase
MRHPIGNKAHSRRSSSSQAFVYSNEKYLQQNMFFPGDMLNYLNFSKTPYATGSDAPISGSNAFPGIQRSPTETPACNGENPSLSAPELIIQAMNSSLELVRVFASKSFSNLAESLRRDLSIKGKIKAIECMGGAGTYSR